MIGSVSIGQYYPVRSFLHELDPRVKLIIVTFITIVIFLTKNFYGFFFLFLFLGVSVFLSKVPPGWILRSLRALIFILVFTFLAHLFFTGGEIILHLGALRVTKEGLLGGLFIVARLILLVVSASLLTFVTTPIELNDGVEYLLSPFEKLGFPVKDFSMMLTIALRFVPLLLVEADRLIKAQKARGASFDSGSFIKRAKSLTPFLVPLFVSIFRRAEELAFAMEARGYRQGVKRTRMKELKMKTSDWLSLVLSVLFLVSIAVMGTL